MPHSSALLDAAFTITYSVHSQLLLAATLQRTVRLPALVTALNDAIAGYLGKSLVCRRNMPAIESTTA